MIEKYKIHLTDGGVIGMKFDHLKNVVSIGGLVRFRRQMLGLIVDYLQNINIPTPRFPQRNKIRFDMYCTNKKLDEALDLLAEHGIVVETVTALERIMR